jgi:hypothetical protein
VHYARDGDVRLAYGVFGDSGPLFVWAPGWVVHNVDTLDEPGSPYAGMVERFAAAGLDFVFGRPTASVDERVLKTVMFTDIVSSTERFSSHGDTHWSHQPNSHDGLMDHQRVAVRRGHTQCGSARRPTGGNARCAGRSVALQRLTRGHRRSVIGRGLRRRLRIVLGESLGPAGELERYAIRVEKVE